MTKQYCRAARLQNNAINVPRCFFTITIVTQDQPETADIASAAEDDGIAFLHIPVMAGSITDANIDDFEAALRKVQGPVLAYCRSGARSISLWALMEAKSLGADAVLATARDAGYDLALMRSRLLERAAVEDES